jgi:hypothetical protein
MLEAKITPLKVPSLISGLGVESSLLQEHTNAINAAKAKLIFFIFF